MLIDSGVIFISQGDLMIIYLKNESLWAEQYLSKELIDITLEAEKYLFGTSIDCSEAVIGDFLMVLAKNQYLKEIFTEKRKMIYKNVPFEDEKIENIFLNDSSLKKMVEVYQKTSKEDIKKRMLINDTSLKYLEVEVVEERLNNQTYIDFIGVGNKNEKYSMSMGSIDNFFFTPLRINYYTTFLDGKVRFFEEGSSNMKLSTQRFFHELSKNLNEMVLKDEEK